MKKTLFFMLVIMSLGLFAQQNKSINSYVSYGTYNARTTDGENQPYIETYIAFDQSSLVYSRGSDGLFDATINVTIVFKQGESIKNYGKYAVRSPKVSDTTNIKGFFMDAQRYVLPNGTYNMEISIDDDNNKIVKPLTVENEILIDIPDKLCFSNIVAVESYKESQSESILSKNGYEIVPMIMPYYPETNNKLTFYTEIYNSKKQLGEDGKYLLNIYISSFESKSKLTNFFFTKRMSAKDTEVIINTIDITNLPSGNYYLVLEARDRNNELIGLNNMFFQRSNPNYQMDMEKLQNINVENTFASKITNTDTVVAYIRSLEAISSDVEKDFAYSLIKTRNLETLQQYFYTFWTSRNNLAPERAWEDYYEQVKRVDASFSTSTLKGCRTDRGIVFLKYGAPDRIVQSPNEPGAYPYEIWHYYTLGNQRNKKFVFMSKDTSTNDYQLIHSDAIGELNNYRWSTEIYSRTYGTYNDYGVDGAAQPNSWGDKAVDYYNNPR